MNGMDARPTGVKWQAGGHVGMVEWGNDANLLVMFYNKPVHVPSESTHGKPVYRDIIHIKIQQPGEMLNIIDRPVQENDKIRFRNQWANFLHDRTQVPDGVPIALLFPNHPSVGENLRGMGVYTIEQCANLTAHAIDNIGRGGQEYVNRAKKYLEMASKGSNFHALQKEIEEEKQKNRIMEQTIASLQAQLNQLQMKVTDPVRASLQPPFIHGYDAQTARINANAPTREHAMRVAQQRAMQRPRTVEDNITDPLLGMTQPVSVPTVEPAQMSGAPDNSDNGSVNVDFS